MPEPNHICKVCGIKYYACDNCDSKNAMNWRAVTCCFEHFQKYMEQMENKENA